MGLFQFVIPILFKKLNQYLALRKANNLFTFN